MDANNKATQKRDTYNKSEYMAMGTGQNSKLPTGPLQAITNAIGGTLGSIAGPVGWLGENIASPLTAAEKIVGYGKELAQSPYKLGKYATETLYSNKSLGEIQESEKRARAIADKATTQAIKDYRSGKIDKNTLATRLKAFQTGTDVVSGATEGLKDVGEMARVGLDVASLLPVGAALSSSVKGVQAAGTAAKTAGVFKVADKGAQSLLMAKIAAKTPGAAKVLQGTGNALTAVGRTGAGKVLGSIETGLIKTGASTEVGHQLGRLTGSDTGKAQKAELIKPGNFRTAVDIVTSMQAAIPFVSSTFNKIGSTKYKIAIDSINTETKAKVANYFAGVKGIDNKIKVQGGGTTTARELVTNDYIRFCKETLRKDVTHIVPEDWDRFTAEMVKSGKWLPNDAEQNITHAITGSMFGRNKKLGRTTEEMKTAMNKQLSSLITTKEQLALPAPKTEGYMVGGTTTERGYKPGKVKYKQGTPDFVTEVNGKPIKGPAEKIPVSQKIIPTSKVTENTIKLGENPVQYGNANKLELIKKEPEVLTSTPQRILDKGRRLQVGASVDPLEGLPKVELNAIEKKVSNAVVELRKTSMGKFFMTKVENGSLMRDIEGKTVEKLDSVTGGKGNKLYASLNRVLDRVESKYIPVGNVKNLRQKYVEMALQEAKMPPSMAKQVMQAMSEANYEGLKMNGIVSMKSKLATISPKFNQLDRVYMSARFGLRPFFWLMQTTESTVYGGIMKGDLVHAASKRNYAGIMATPEYGKGAKTVKADMKISGTNEVLEKTAATSEKIKRAKAQALHFTDSFADSLMSTPYGKKFKSVDEIPAFKEYVKGLDESTDKVSYVQNYIKENSYQGAKNFAEQGMVSDGDVALKMSVPKAATSAAKKGEPMYLYNTSRSPFERGLHQIMFPASYTKKIVTEGSKWLTKGSGSRVLITNEGLKQYSGLRDRIENAAVDHPQLRPVIALMNVFDPLSTDFPLSIGGATPFYRTIEKMATNPGKYNLKTVKGTNEVVKQLAPNIREYERYVGFGYNAVGKEEPKYAQSFYPQYLEENRKTAKGKIFNQE